MWASKLSPVASDGRDGNALKRFTWDNILNFNAMPANITKNMLLLVLPDEICLISSS